MPNAKAPRKSELEKLLGDASSGQKPNFPSPQAVEAIWLRLISRKEHEFVQEISRILKPAHAPSHPGTGKEQLVEVETLVSEMLAEDRYEDRMQCFFRETARSTPGHVPFKDSQAKRLELIDATYRTGVRDALRRAPRDAATIVAPPSGAAANTPGAQGLHDDGRRDHRRLYDHRSHHG